MAKGRAVICNIGPHEFFFSRSYGQFRILGNAAHLPFTLTIIEDKQDRIDMGDKQYLPWPVAAAEIANDLVTNENIKPHGCFVCAGERPTAAELDQAQELRMEYYKKMIAQGDELWAKYHRHELIDDNSRRAALALGEEREWAFKVVAKIDCPGCGAKILPMIARHSCGWVVNIDRAEQGGIISPEEARRLRALQKRKTTPAAAVKGGGTLDATEDAYEDPAEAVAAKASK